MNRPFIKISVLAIVSLGLIYYSVAWAVLKCFHDEDQSNQQVVLNNDQDFHYTSADPASLNLECVCPDYHTEVIAGSSSASQLDRPLHIAGSPVSQTTAGDRVANTWLRAVFEGLSSPFWGAVHRYLSLSTLRI